MPRLRNVQTGAVVSCSDETAQRLGTQWEPAEPKAKKSAAKPAKTADKQD